MKKKRVFISLWFMLLLTACSHGSEEEEVVTGMLTAISDDYLELQVGEGIERVQFDFIQDEDGYEIDVNELKNGMYVSVETGKKYIATVMLDLWTDMEPSGLPGTMVAQPLICSDEKIYQKTLETVDKLPANTRKLFDVAVNRIKLEKYGEQEALNIAIGTPVYGDDEMLYVERQDNGYDIYKDQETLTEYNKTNGFIYMITKDNCEIRLLNGDLVRVVSGNVVSSKDYEPIPLNQLVTSSHVSLSMNDKGEQCAILLADMKQGNQKMERQIYLGQLYVEKTGETVALPENAFCIGKVEYDVVKNYEGDLSYFGAAHNIPVGSRIYQVTGEDDIVYVEVEQTYFCLEKEK